MAVKRVNAMMVIRRTGHRNGVVADQLDGGVRRQADLLVQRGILQRQHFIFPIPLHTRKLRCILGKIRITGCGEILILEVVILILLRFRRPRGDRHQSQHQNQRQHHAENPFLHVSPSSIFAIYFLPHLGPWHLSAPQYSTHPPPSGLLDTNRPKNEPNRRPAWTYLLPSTQRTCFTYWV